MKKIVCDICGKNEVTNEYKIKVKHKWWLWWEAGWEKLDLCDECQDKFLYLKELKGDTND